MMKIFRINFLILFYFFYFITLNAQNSGKDWYFISIKEKNDICLTSLKHEWFHGTKEDCDKYLENLKKGQPPCDKGKIFNVGKEYCVKAYFASTPCVFAAVEWVSNGCRHGGHNQYKDENALKNDRFLKDKVVKVIINDKSVTKEKKIELSNDSKLAISELKEIFDQAEILNIALSITVFQKIFSHTVDGLDPVKGAFAIHEVATGEWEQISLALRKIPNIPKKAALDLCDNQILIHEAIKSNSNGKYLRNNDEIKFWKNMRKELSKL